MREKSFIRLLSAFLFSTLGDGLTLIAIPWLSTSLTRNPLLVSMVTASMSIPWLLFSLHVGLMIDKYSKKRLLIISLYFRIFLLIILIFLILSKLISIPLLMIFGFLLGCSKVIFDSTSQTLTPEIVSEENLEKANGWITTIRLTMSDVVGRAIGGILIAFTIITPFIFDIILLILASYFILKLDLKNYRVTNTRKKLELKEGFQFILNNNNLLLIMVVIGSIVTFLFSSTLATQILLMREVLNLSSFSFGLIISISTIGSLLASNMVAITSKIDLKLRMIVSIFIMGLTFGSVGLTRNFFLVGLLYFIGSYFIVVWNIATVSYRQRITPQVLLGRVGGIVRLFSLGFSPLGMLFGGGLVYILSDYMVRDWAIRIPNIILGVILVIISIVLLIIFKSSNFDEKKKAEVIK